jgi:hypothetical protein
MIIIHQKLKLLNLISLQIETMEINVPKIIKKINIQYQDHHLLILNQVIKFHQDIKIMNELKYFYD